MFAFDTSTPGANAALVVGTAERNSVAYRAELLQRGELRYANPPYGLNASLRVVLIINQKSGTRVMALPTETKVILRDYAFAHIADEQWHFDFFSFISDRKLAKRLGEEFISTRVLYKILEGLEAQDWLLRAQIRQQVLSYASIYEAAIHYILFEKLPETPEVIALTEFPTKKMISIPSQSLALLEKHLEHDGHRIIPTYEAIGRTDETKVRFDRKAECAYQLGFLESWLRDELVEFYEARNAIHIHAEIRKSLDYQIDLSRRAYMRMEPFRDQARTRLLALGLL